MKIFADDLPFYKANLHTHTTASDGKRTPEESMRMYRDAGYDVLAITDHRKVTQVENAPEGLLMLPGIELDYMLKSQAVHIVGLNVRPEIGENWNRQGTPQEGVDLIRQFGGEAILAHPAWSLNTPKFMSELQGVIATEIWNSVSNAPTNPNRADSSVLIDVTAASFGRLLPVVASDDTHGYGAEFAAGATMIQAEALTVPAVMDALKAGRFYATQGPRIRQIEIEDGQLRVQCSEAATVMFYSALPWAAGRCICGENITECAYQLHKGDRFVRVLVMDQAGKCAWSSPVDVTGLV